MPVKTNYIAIKRITRTGYHESTLISSLYYVMFRYLRQHNTNFNYLTQFIAIRKRNKRNTLLNC